MRLTIQPSLYYSKCCTNYPAIVGSVVVPVVVVVIPVVVISVVVIASALAAVAAILAPVGGLICVKRDAQRSPLGGNTPLAMVVVSGLSGRW
jgi:hypothetical protein